MPLYQWHWEERAWGRWAQGFTGDGPVQILKDEWIFLFLSFYLLTTMNSYLLSGQGKEGHSRWRDWHVQRQAWAVCAEVCTRNYPLVVSAVRSSTAWAGSRWDQTGLRDWQLKGWIYHCYACRIPPKHRGCLNNSNFIILSHGFGVLAWGLLVWF